MQANFNSHVISTNRVNGIWPKATQKEAEDQNLQEVTVDNYEQVAGSLFNGNSPERLFILAYFQIFNGGELPTSEAVGKKYLQLRRKKSESLNIEGLKDKVNKELKERGDYNPLDFFPRGTKDLAEIYRTFKNIKREKGEDSSITIQDISERLGKNIGFVSSIVATKDFSRISKLDPSFGKVFEELSTQALGVQFAIIDTRETLSKAHQWEVDPDTLESLKDLILRPNLESDSLITASGTADQYVFMLRKELGELLENSNDISDKVLLDKVRTVKVDRLLQKLKEENGISEDTFKIAWCFFKAKGSNHEVPIKNLLIEIKKHTGKEIDLLSLINALRDLERFTGKDFSTDLFSQIKNIVKEKAKYAPNGYRKLLDVVYTNILLKDNFKGLGVTEGVVEDIVKANIGLTEKEYVIYKACQKLSNSNESERKIVSEEDLLSTLKEASFGISFEQIKDSLSKIEKIFDESFTLHKPSDEERQTMVKDLDQRARRNRGLLLKGHYKAPATKIS